MAKSNAKEKDALHLASSVYGKCDYFITCDDKLIATIIGNRLDKEIIEKGSKALIRELGYSGFLRFIRQIDEYGNEDYLEIEKEIFEDMSLDHIYDSATKYWENKKA